ncbi:DUF1360 domain-containing protein [Streptomyces tendae]
MRRPLRRPGTHRRTQRETPRDVGDLISCPFYTEAWMADGLVGTYAVAPRAGRPVCAGLSAVVVSDWPQHAWSPTAQKAEE